MNIKMIKGFFNKNSKNSDAVEIYKFIAKYISDKKFGHSLTALTNIITDFISIYMKNKRPDVTEEDALDSLLRSFNHEIKETFKHNYGSSNEKMRVNPIMKGLKENIKNERISKMSEDKAWKRVDTHIH